MFYISSVIYYILDRLFSVHLISKLQITVIYICHGTLFIFSLICKQFQLDIRRSGRCSAGGRIGICLVVHHLTGVMFRTGVVAGRLMYWFICALSSLMLDLMIVEGRYALYWYRHAVCE
jgi:hypothetical protein